MNKMTEIIKQEPKTDPMVLALQELWLDDKFIAKTLKHIATNAITQNNKGDEIEDFHAKLKAIQVMLKIKDKRFDQGWINLNFFNAPSIDNLKY